MSDTVFNALSANHSMFFKAEEKRTFSDVLAAIQEYLSEKYSSLVIDSISTNGGDEGVKAQVKRYIQSYIIDNRIEVDGLSETELVDKLYSEMAEYSVLTPFIFGKGVEEINVNGWDDIEVQFSDGRSEKLSETFESPEHAINVVRRMLHVSGTVLDNSTPTVVGDLGANIRIAAAKTPVVDEAVGVAASIRIVNKTSLKKEDFVRSGTATGDMLDFLSLCYRYGMSTCIAGATSSGKTTIANWILTTIPDEKRLVTIENGSREIDLVKRDKDGRVVNNVLHLKTRDSEDSRKRVTQDDLLDLSLRLDPAYLFLAEMRSVEANATQEAARTGHCVLTTIHSNSCEATWRRIMTLCKRVSDLPDEMLMCLITEAFPIVAFAKQLENKQRRIMEIMECEITPEGERIYHSLFQYRIKENRTENGKAVIIGEHVQTGTPSESCLKRLLDNGAPQEVIDKLRKGAGK